MSLYRNLKIKDWAVEDRPREKMLSKGLSSLTDAELLAIIIGSGNTTESAVELGKRILSAVKNNLSELGKLTVKELEDFNGIGPAKAINIIAALELGRRYKTSGISEKNQISGSRDVYDLFESRLSYLPHEEFWILLLNRSNKIVHQAKISQGGVAGTVADVKIIMKMALEKLASSIVLIHNHPSGNCQPSNSDIDLTEKIRNAGKTMDINVLDHIIVTELKYYSFADEGLL